MFLLNRSCGLNIMLIRNVDVVFKKTFNIFRNAGSDSGIFISSHLNQFFE